MVGIPRACRANLYYLDERSSLVGHVGLLIAMMFFHEKRLVKRFVFRGAISSSNTKLGTFVVRRESMQLAAIGTPYYAKNLAKPRLP